MLELAIALAMLPVAAATGWYVARRQDGHRRRKETTLSSSYFRGLNYLLNEQPDKAIEVFLKIAEINKETVETHMALGNLFRRRGEMDKAIRFHKHIITRPDLSDHQRTAALFELGEDYMRAGLLDRAERLFSELLEHDPRAELPARQLLDIYQQEKDWEKAIDKARYLRSDGEMTDRLVAQFHCEIAQEALDRGDAEQVKRTLRQARRCDPRSARPRLLQAELAWRNQEWQAAAEHFQEACEFDSDCSIAVMDRLIECHRRLGTLDSLRDWLSTSLDRSAISTPSITLARLIAESEPQQAVEFMLDRLTQRPTVRGLEYLMELLNQEGVSLDQVGPELIRTLMQRLLEGQPRYRCQQCGFSGNAGHWLCPSCRRWNTTRVITGVLGE